MTIKGEYGQACRCVFITVRGIKVLEAPACFCFKDGGEKKEEKKKDGEQQPVVESNGGHMVWLHMWAMVLRFPQGPCQMTDVDNRYTTNGGG